MRRTEAEKNGPLEGLKGTVHNLPSAQLEARREFGDEPVVTVSTAARFLGMSPRTIRHYCKEGRLRGAWQYDSPQGKGDWRIPLETIMGFRR
jgi:hypothetical protein